MKIRDTFRSLYPEIVKFWHRVEKKFLYTAKHGKPCTMPRGLSFRQTDEVNVIITLPSGRELKYHKVRVKAGKFGKDQAKVYNPKEHKWEYIWGGTITENIVQAIARDVLWEAIIKVEDAGYRVVHHVHDELIALCKIGEGKAALDIAIEALRTRPSWLPDCPMNAEGLVTDRYGGH
jgi:DNA polymerase